MCLDEISQNNSWANWYILKSKFVLKLNVIFLIYTKANLFVEFLWDKIILQKMLKYLYLYKNNFNYNLNYEWD